MKINLTFSNLLMFVGGLTLMIIALYRISPMKIAWPASKPLLIQTGPLFIFLIIVTIWLFFVGGATAEKEALKGTFSVTASFLPMMLVLFPVIAFAGELVKYYQSDIDEMLTGKFGYPGTLFAAFIVPTTNAASKAVKTFWENPSLRPILMYFLCSVALVCWPIYFIRSLGLTNEISWEMYKVNWMVAVGISPAFWLWSRAVTYGSWKTAITSLL